MNADHPSWVRIPTGCRRLHRSLPFVGELQWQQNVAVPHGRRQALVLQELSNLVQASVTQHTRRHALLKQELSRHALVLRVHWENAKRQFAALTKSLRRAYQNRTKVTKDDKHCIYDYTSSGFGIMNQYCRGGPAATDATTDVEMNRPAQVQKRVQGLVRALEKRIAAFEGTVYRVVTFENEETAQQFLRGIPCGSTFQDQAFMSTSKSESRFANPEGGKRVVQFVVASKTGVNIKKFSAHEDEDEVLFRPKALFRVHGVSELASGVTRVEMGEIV